MKSSPRFSSLLLFFLFQFELEVKLSDGNGMENMKSMLGVSPHLNWTPPEVDKAIPTEKSLSYFFAVQLDYLSRLIETEGICSAALPGTRLVPDQNDTGENPDSKTMPTFQRKGNAQTDTNWPTFDTLPFSSLTQTFDAEPKFHNGSRTREGFLSNKCSCREQIPDKPQLRVFMVKPIEDVMAKSIWIFMKPFGWELWLTIFMACSFVGISIGILELRANDNNSEFEGPLHRQLSIMLWIPISMVFFPERRKVVNKWSKFVLLVWLALSFIVFQCYTAKLTSMLTVDEPQPLFNELERPYIAGYRNGSFVKKFLVEDLKFSESRLKPYSTIDEYHKTLSKGSHNGGVDAIFDELPYVKFLLLKYGSKYTKVGPIHKTSAFGFKKTGYDEVASVPPQSPSLKTISFGGLFIITGAATIFALVCSEISRWQRFSKRQSSNRLELRVHPTVEMRVTGDSPTTENQEQPPTTSNQSNWNVSLEEEEHQQQEEVVVVVVEVVHLS